MPTTKNLLRAVYQWLCYILWGSIVFAPLALIVMMVHHMIVFDIERFKRKPYMDDWRDWPY